MGFCSVSRRAALCCAAAGQWAGAWGASPTALGFVPVLRPDRAVSGSCLALDPAAVAKEFGLWCWTRLVCPAQRKPSHSLLRSWKRVFTAHPRSPVFQANKLPLFTCKINFFLLRWFTCKGYLSSMCPGATLAQAFCSVIPDFPFYRLTSAATHLMALLQREESLRTCCETNIHHTSSMWLFCQHVCS